MPFTDAAWSSPESDLTPEQFCSVCLIDENPSGQKKVKGLCHLPIRSRPGAPINQNAVFAAAGGRGITRLKGVSAENKRKAANRIIRLYSELGRLAPEGIFRIAGKARPKEK